MEFLKELFGGKPMTFDELVQAVNAHNGNEANKDKQIKIGNLGTGEYVGKGKYDALQELVNGKETELKSANDLIAELKLERAAARSPVIIRPRTPIGIWFLIY